MSASKERIPVTIIGGFLGAGKTTLVNHILETAEGRRLVVFVNDFGEINIDLELIDTVEEDRIALTNGCVCCTLNNNLITSITDYAKQDANIDGFVIEASGVSDPRQLSSSLTLLEEAAIARLDSSIYVFDAYTFAQLAFEDQELIIDHACYADLVLLNKVDSVNADALAGIQDLLAESAPYSRIVKTRYCSIDKAVLFGHSNSRDDSNINYSNRSGLNNAIDLQHVTRFTSFSIVSDKPVDRLKFKYFVELLHQICIRAKGFISFKDDSEKDYSFNLVGNRATLEQRKSAIASSSTELVFIGESSILDENTIKNNFRLCI